MPLSKAVSKAVSNSAVTASLRTNIALPATGPSTPGARTAALRLEREPDACLGFGRLSVSVVHESASEFWKVLKQFELFSLTVGQA